MVRAAHAQGQAQTSGEALEEETAVSTGSVRSRPRLRDRDVRSALLAQVLAEHERDPATLVVQEFGIDHGACRVDVCVINGSFHGYELKSESDTLVRLPNQIARYGRCLDLSTIVTAPSHLRGVEALIPEWWGIKLVEPFADGEVRISTARMARRNPAPSPIHIAGLLWRDEAALLLTSLGAPMSVLRGNRRQLYAQLAENVPLPTLRKFVREMVKSRGTWRRPELPA